MCALIRLQFFRKTVCSEYTFVSHIDALGPSGQKHKACTYMDSMIYATPLLSAVRTPNNITFDYNITPKAGGFEYANILSLGRRVCVYANHVGCVCAHNHSFNSNLFLMIE